LQTAAGDPALAARSDASDDHRVAGQWPGTAQPARGDHFGCPRV